MAVNHVVHRIIRPVGIATSQDIELFSKGLRVDVVEDEKGEKILSQSVVHRSVQITSLEPGSSKMKKLAQNVSLRLHLFGGLSNGANEIGMQVFHSVEPPAVDIGLLEPVSDHSKQILSHLRVGKIELGHLSVAGKTTVVRFRAFDNRYRVDVKPFPVAGLFTPVRRVNEERVFDTAVVENSVQQDSHPPHMNLLDQFYESLVSAQSFVYFEVIAGIVFVVRRRIEDGSQVYTVDSELLQIIQLMDDSSQVSSVEAIPLGRGTPVKGFRRIVVRFTVEERVGKYLINDGVACPFRRF